MFILNNALLINFLEGGPRATRGGIGDFVGILQQIWNTVVLI